MKTRGLSVAAQKQHARDDQHGKDEQAYRVGQDAGEEGRQAGEQQGNQYQQDVVTEHRACVASEFQRLDRRVHPAVIAAPVKRRVIDIQLHLVAVRVAQVDALADGVVGQAIDVEAGLPDALTGGPEVFQRIADLPAGVVEATSLPVRRGWRVADLDQQQLVMGGTTAQQGAAAAGPASRRRR